MPPAEQSKTFYRVIVAPDRQDVTAYGRSEPLQASMQVDARVLLERRPIINGFSSLFIASMEPKSANQQRRAE